MLSISDIQKKYSGKLDFLDLELILAHSLGKTREFVLTYPEHEISKSQISNLKSKLKRRMQNEPIAYILGHKEFYGLDFMVNKHTLVPRPETEMLVEQALTESKVKSFASSLSSGRKSKVAIMDIGTGSGCIITAIAHNMEHGTWNMEQKNDIRFFATDISANALKIAKKNAKLHGLDKKIKFFKGDLLAPFIGNWKPALSADRLEIGNSRMIILANLPYLSKEVYNSAPVDVKKFEPKSALYSPEFGLQHYRKLLQQVKKLQVINKTLSVTLFLEFSPEQKTSLAKLIKTMLPSSKSEFEKDLAGKWRICKITC